MTSFKGPGFRIFAAVIAVAALAIGMLLNTLNQ